MPPASASSTRARPTALLALAAIFLVARIAAGIHESRQPVREGGLVDWTPSAQAEASAITGQRPVLYEFSATWCEPCKQMDREVFSDPTAADFINRTFIAVRVPDEDRDVTSSALRKRHRIVAMPTIVVEGGRAKDARRLEGYPGKRRMMEFLRGAATMGRAW